jgi:hypothetical protein
MKLRPAERAFNEQTKCALRAGFPNAQSVRIPPCSVLKPLVTDLREGPESINS